MVFRGTLLPLVMKRGMHTFLSRAVRVRVGVALRVGVRVRVGVFVGVGVRVDSGRATSILSGIWANSGSGTKAVARKVTSTTWPCCERSGVKRKVDAVAPNAMARGKVAFAGKPRVSSVTR